MNRWLWKAPLIVVLIGASIGSVAADRVQIVGLFKDRAVVRIDGQQRLLRVGQRSPEGVKLISADSRVAVLEVDGRSIELMLHRGIGGQYREPGNGPEVRIYRSSNGMFTTVGSINGLPVDLLIDTGASQVAMNAIQARRLGVDFRVDGQLAAVSTASGYARAYAVKLGSVKVGAIELRNVDALVIDGEHPSHVLLGMSFLGRVEMVNSDEALVLKQKY